MQNLSPISRSRPAGVLLLLALAASAAVFALPDDWLWGGADKAERGAAHWLEQTESLRKEGRTAQALETTVSALTSYPWHPELARLRTRLYLDAEDAEGLFDWMDEVTIGDPRLAEQLFGMPELRPWLERERFQALQREAYRQARD